MRQTKRRYEIFSFYDQNGIARHLEKMAEKGWLLEKITTFYWKYRRIEPQTLHFFVAYAPKTSEFDPVQSEERQTFQEFCSHTGWKFVTSSAQMQIFYNERENPVPIETDPESALDTIHRSARKSFLPAYFVLLLISLFQVGMFVFLLHSNPVSTLANASRLFTGVVWPLVILLCIVDLIEYYTWRHQAKKAVAQGRFWETTGHTRFKQFFFGGILIITLIALAYWLLSLFADSSGMMPVVGLLSIGYMLALILLVNGIKQLLKKKNVSTGITRTVTIVSSFVLSFGMLFGITFGIMFASEHGVFAQSDEETYEYNGHTFTAFQEELPLTVEDLLDVPFDGYTREVDSEVSPLLAQYKMYQYARWDAEHREEMPSINYTMIQVKVSFLYDWCKQNLIADGADRSGESYEAMDAIPWGAQEAYRYQWDGQYLNQYLLCYNRYIVEISFDWEPTVKQMEIVGEKLTDAHNDL